MPPTWLVLTLIAWTLVSVGVGVLIGRSIRLADQQASGGVSRTTLPAAVSFAVARSTQRRTLTRRWWW